MDSEKMITQIKKIIKKKLKGTKFEQGVGEKSS